MSDEQQNSEQSSVESSENIIEQSDQTQDQSSEETQQDSTSQQEDTSHKINTSGSKLGLTEKAEEESSESSEDTSESLDSIVSQALTGELTDEQRKIIDDAGLGAHFDMIVQGHRANIEKNDAEIVGVVGGQEAYGELQEWASANLDDASFDAYNRAVIDSGDMGIAKLAVAGLQAMYLKANGSAPDKVIEAGGTSNESHRPYSNRDEYIDEAMSVKYQTDPEYAKQVEAKRNLSGF
jgi:hypothetical protein